MTDVKIKAGTHKSILECSPKQQSPLLNKSLYGLNLFGKVVNKSHNVSLNLDVSPKRNDPNHLDLVKINSFDQHSAMESVASQGIKDVKQRRALRMKTRKLLYENKIDNKGIKSNHSWKEWEVFQLREDIQTRTDEHLELLIPF